MLLLSQFREQLAELQDAEGDMEVRFPAMVTADFEDDMGSGIDTVQIEGIALMVDQSNAPAFVLIGDTYTLDSLA